MIPSRPRLLPIVVSLLLHGAALGAMLVAWQGDEPADVSDARVIDITLSMEGESDTANEEAAPLASEAALVAAAEESHLGATAAVIQTASEQKAMPEAQPNEVLPEEMIKPVETEQVPAEQPKEQKKVEQAEPDRPAETIERREQSEVASVEGSDIQRSAQAASAGSFGSRQNGKGKAKASGGERSAAPYARLVASELARHKAYPAQARDRNLIGTVALTFTIGEAGHIIAHAIVQSSGYKELDDAAETMLAAARFPPPPSGRFTASVPVRFERR